MGELTNEHNNKLPQYIFFLNSKCDGTIGGWGFEDRIKTTFDEQVRDLISHCISRGTHDIVNDR